MQFESITPLDLNEIRKLQPEGWTDIIPDIEFYLRSPFCNSFKVLIDGNIVGMGTTIIFDNTAWIAHIIVGSDYRNQGIGFQLVNYLLEKLEKASIATCSLVATDFGKPVYLKAGYRIVGEYTFLQRETPWKEYPASEKIIPFKEEYRTMIYELDKKISGENREQLLTGFLQHSLLYVDQNEVHGYYIPDLKEGLIFADTNEAGLELMRLKYSKVDYAVLPSGNTAGLEFLLQNGFTETKKATRMVWGKDIDWKPKNMFSRIGGNLG